MHPLHTSSIGTLIRINDVDLIILLADIAPKTLPDFLTKGHRTFRDGRYQISIIDLDHIGSTGYDPVLVVKSFDDVTDFMLYNRPDFFEPECREVLMEDADTAWLFDGDNYPQEIYSDDIIYTRNVQSEVFDNRTAIIEWKTPSKIINYQLMLIETGLHNPRGGWVEFYEGRQINDNDITL